MGWFQDFFERRLGKDENASALYKAARRVVVAIIGFTVLLIGVAMLVLPGPGTVVIPAGLAILGLEFVWARRFLRHLRDSAWELGRRVSGSERRRSPASKEEPSDPPPPGDDLKA